MAVLPVLKWPDPRLSRRADPVDETADELRALVRDMFDTMYSAKGRGLAAPQVGRMLRVFVMDEGWKSGAPTPLVAVNPRVLWRSETVEPGPEGCLSIPGLTVIVPRATAVRLRWSDLDGKANERMLTGFAAICAQHEIDHLDGVVTLDRVSETERLRLTPEYGG